MFKLDIIFDLDAAVEVIELLPPISWPEKEHQLKQVDSGEALSGTIRNRLKFEVKAYTNISSCFLVLVCFSFWDFLDVLPLHFFTDGSLLDSNFCASSLVRAVVTIVTFIPC